MWIMTRRWIENRLREIGKRKIELGKALGLSPPRISDLIGGTRRIQSRELPQLSIFLNLDMGTILNHIHQEYNNEEAEKHTRTEQIIVVGNLKASESQYDLWPGCDHYTITLPIQASFTSISKFALEERRPLGRPKKLYICVKEADLRSPPKPGFVRITDTANKRNSTKPKILEKGDISWNREDRTPITIAFIIGNYQQL